MGPHFGGDLAALRVHNDGRSDDLARSMQARAFTFGRDIYFARGQYAPHTPAGMRLLAHELSHAVAPAASAVGPVTIGPADDPAERLADMQADRVIAALRRRAAELTEQNGQAATGRDAAHTVATLRGSAVARRAADLSFQAPLTHTADVADPVAETTEHPAADPVRLEAAIAGLVVPGRSRVIRRSLSISGTSIAKPDDLLSIVGRMAWDSFEQRVLQYMCDTTVRDFELRKSKWRDDFKKYLAKMPKDFYAGLTTVKDCDAIADGLSGWKVKDTTGRLAARRKELFVAETKAEFAPDFGLDAPKLPKSYSPSIEKTYKPQAEGGDRPPWQKTANTYTGKGQTGIQNLEISDELVKRGLMQKSDEDGRWYAVCASCLKWVDAAMMDSDHVQALSILKKKLMTLAKLMSADPTVYDTLDTTASVKPSPVSQFFIVKGKGKDREFNLSQEGLTAYSHNMGNLIKMCKACNQGEGKHGGDLRTWLAKNPFFGQAFADKFATGPGTARVVEKTMSGEMPAEMIYKHLEDTFGSSVQSSYPSLQLQLFSHRTLTSHAQSRFETKSLPDTDATKKEKEKELDLRERRADHLVKSTRSVHAHFKNDDLPPMAPGSPEREDKELKQYFKDKETKRREKRDREEPDYPTYFASASQGTPTDVTKIPAPKKARIAEQANREGQQEYEKGVADGTQAALTADLTADHTAALSTKSAGYKVGFQATLTRRAKAFTDGEAHGLTGSLLVPPTADLNPAVSHQLMVDYMAGYNVGLAKKMVVV